MGTDSQNYNKQSIQPRDARIVSLIIQSLGVEDYDPKVVHQLLEFAHRYTSDVFQDALVYSEHAQKNDIELEDIQLAIQGRVNYSFTTPPPKEFLLELAQEKNKTPLPLIPEKYGIRLPSEKHCLTGINFSIVPDAPPPPKPVLDRIVTDSQESNSSNSNINHNNHNNNNNSASQSTPPPPPSAQPAKRGRDLMEDDDYDF